MIENKKIFITGGAGFIGSTLVGMIIDKNEVTVYDNFGRDSLSGKEFANHKNLTIIRGDILDYERLSHAMSDHTHIIHCAAVAGVDSVISNPTNAMRVNMIGSANVLEAASKLDKKKVERVLCFSTSEVFGSSCFRSDENDTTSIGVVGEARWVYAIAKLAEEHLAHAYFKQFGLPTVCVRPFNIYGPGQVGPGAMKIFIERAIKNEDIFIHGDGIQIRAWCYVDDMIEGVLLALTHPRAIGESFNIGNHRTVVTIYGLAETIVRVLNSKSKIKFINKDYADVELRVPSTKKALELIGYRARVDLEEGILKTAEYYRNKI